MPDPSESRFASSTHTAEDLLKEQTVGLVHYSDFRKRRAEALEQSGGSGASTPTGNESRYVLRTGTCNRRRRSCTNCRKFKHERSLTDQAQ